MNIESISSSFQFLSGKPVLYVMVLLIYKNERFVLERKKIKRYEKNKSGHRPKYVYVTTS